MVACAAAFKLAKSRPVDIDLTDMVVILGGVKGRVFSVSLSVQNALEVVILPYAGDGTPVRKVTIEGFDWIEGSPLAAVQFQTNAIGCASFVQFEGALPLHSSNENPPTELMRMPLQLPQGTPLPLPSSNENPPTELMRMNVLDYRYCSSSHSSNENPPTSNENVTSTSPRYSSSSYSNNENPSTVTSSHCWLRTSGT